jgi:lipoyl(octanoyl) transferase
MASERPESSRLAASTTLAASERIVVHDLGRLAYADALALQRSAHAEVIADRERGAVAPMPVFLLEHDPPVITVSRRPGAAEHLLATPELLAEHGVTLAETDRGGDITYHGPGQLIAYPILDLNRLGFRVHGYMRWLESIVIETIASFGVVGHRDHCATGVWVGGEVDASASAVDNAAETPSCADAARGGRKICAMGVRVARWVAMHGLALNVQPDMRHFGLIVPCGLVGRPVTSLTLETGMAPPMDLVKRRLADAFVRAADGITLSAEADGSADR